jgi:hypothetical protein
MARHLFSTRNEATRKNSLIVDGPAAPLIPEPSSSRTQAFPAIHSTDIDHPDGCGYSRSAGFIVSSSGARRGYHDVVADKVFVDYSGKKIAIVDPTTGGVRDAKIFGAVLGPSSERTGEKSLTSKGGPRGPARSCVGRRHRGVARRTSQGRDFVARVAGGQDARANARLRLPTDAARRNACRACRSRSQQIVAGSASR